MKTIIDLLKMKEIRCAPFGNQYSYLIYTLEDYIISKLDGSDRVYQCLQDWDLDAKKYIVNDLVNLLKQDGLADFNEIDFRNKMIN